MRAVARAGGSSNSQFRTYKGSVCERFCGLQLVLRIVCGLSEAPIILGGWCYRPLPQLDGSALLPGLQKEATVVRDRWGLPHIRRGFREDLAGGARLRNGGPGPPVADGFACGPVRARTSFFPRSSAKEKRWRSTKIFRHHGIWGAPAETCTWN